MISNKKIDKEKQVNFKINIFANKHTGRNSSNMENAVNVQNNKFKHPPCNFTDYLNEHRYSSTNKGGISRVFTHTSMSQPFGKFAIPQNDMKKFMSLYEKELQKGSSLGITEKP